MNVVSARELRVHIGRLSSRINLSSRHPSPEAVRNRLHRVMERAFADACRRVLGGALDDQNDAICFIERLEVELTLDVARCSDEEIADALARKLALAIRRALTHPGGAKAQIFRDSTVLLAQFFIDLAEGRAWERWEYADFESLRLLPAGTAVREAILREPEIGEAALFLLASEQRLEKVLRLLSDEDARRILAALGALDFGTEAEDRRAMEALAAAWPETVTASPRDLAPAQAALRLYLAARRATEPVSRARLHAALEPILFLAGALQMAPAPEEWIRRFARGDARGAAQIARESGLRAGFEHLPYLRRVMQGDAEWLERIAETVSPRRSHEERKADARPAESMEGLETEFAGLFLLLPSLIELEIPQAFDALLPVQSENHIQIRILLWRLAGKLMGSAGAARDPAILLAVGLPSPPTEDALREIAEAVNASTLIAFQQQLLRRLHRQGRFAGKEMAVEQVRLPSGDPALLLRELSSGFWAFLEAVTDAESQEEAFARGVRRVQEVCELSADEMAVTVDSGVSRSRIESDLAYFAAGAPLDSEFGQGFDLALSLAAHAVLRTFAAQLIGFQTGSAVYLHQNFLAGTGRVAANEDGFEVWLPASPLRMMLRMAGMNERVYALPWLGGTQVTLHLPED